MGAGTARGAAMVCVVLATAGAVGSSGGCGSDAHTPARSAATAKNVRMLSQSELERAVVGPKDVPGWQMSTLSGRGGDGLRIAHTIVDAAHRIRATPAVCQPLYDMVRFTSAEQYHGEVEQAVSAVEANGADKPGGPSILMSLRSYAVADAPKVIADLRASLRRCTSFRSHNPLDPETGWTDPRPLKDPRVGDEAVSYRLTQIVPSVDSNGDDDGGAPVDVPFVFTVVRSGGTIAAFSDESFPHTQLPRIPMDVVRAQIGKLAKTG